MKIDMKQRIIGVIVIIALAIILIPLFVSQYQHDEIIKQAQISQQPETPNVNSVNQLQALNNQITEQAQDKVDWQALQPASVAETPPTQAANLTQADNVATAEPVQPAITSEPTPTNSETLQTNPEISANQAQAIAANPPSELPTQTNTETPASTEQLETSSIANNQPSAPTLSTTKPAQPKAKSAEKPKTNKLTKSTTPNIYLVQLGNFSSKKNAAILKNRLEKHGFHPAIKENHGHFRVLVGPATSHEKAAQKLQLIVQKVHVSGFLVKG